MSNWSLKQGEEITRGLTLAQLEKRVRSGNVAAHAEISSGGAWMRVDAVPYFRRHLPATEPRSEKGPGSKHRPEGSERSSGELEAGLRIPGIGLHSAETPPQTPVPDSGLPLHPFALAQMDETGKVLPPDPKQVDALLQTMSMRPRAERMKNAAKWLWALAVVILIIETIAFGNLLLQGSLR